MKRLGNITDEQREGQYARGMKPLVRLPAAFQKTSISAINKRIDHILAAVQERPQNGDGLRDFKVIPKLALANLDSSRSHALSTGRARPADLNSQNASMEGRGNFFQRHRRSLHSPRHSENYQRERFESRHKSTFSVLSALPQPGEVVLQSLQSSLSEYEQSEILDYPEVYYIGIPTSKQKDEFDDEKGYYKVVIGDHIAYRYQVLDALGQGSFGQVLKILDHKAKVLLALKIIRNKKKFIHQAAVEARILIHLAKVDLNDDSNIVHVKECFQFRKHTCFTFELLSYNLYEFLKFNKFQGLSLELIRRLAGQVLIALKTLSECNIIHCDLKPENILLKHPNKSAIKVIDFGSSCYSTERLYKYIQSRYYRAPEVILGMPYSPAIDIWSFGCICAELSTGRPLFPGTSEFDQLLCIMEVKGVPPSGILEQSSRKMLFFDELGSPRAPRKGKKREMGSKSLGDILRSADSRFLDFIDSKTY